MAVPVGSAVARRRGDFNAKELKIIAKAQHLCNNRPLYPMPMTTRLSTADRVRKV
jgi:hypothetical protein